MSDACLGCSRIDGYHDFGCKAAGRALSAPKVPKPDPDAPKCTCVGSPGDPDWSGHDSAFCPLARRGESRLDTERVTLYLGDEGQLLFAEDAEEGEVPVSYIRADVHERVVAQLRTAREALTWYANPDNMGGESRFWNRITTDEHSWWREIDDDNGDRARAAIAALPPEAELRAEVQRLFDYQYDRDEIIDQRDLLRAQLAAVTERKGFTVSQEEWAAMCAIEALARDVALKQPEATITADAVKRLDDARKASP